MVARLEAGTVLGYLGTEEDDFGREWQVVGLPSTARRRSSRYYAPFDAAAYRDLRARGDGAVAFLDLGDGEEEGRDETRTFVFGEPSSSRKAADREAAEERVRPWWRRIEPLGPDVLPRFTDVAAVDVSRIPWVVALEALDLRGGLETLGGWPDDPIPGQLHVPASLPLVFRWNGDGWELGEPPRFVGSVFGLLDNPLLSVDREGAPVADSPPLPCWTFGGAVDAYGEIAGGLAPAPEAHEPSFGKDAWRADALGRRNLGALLLPVIDEDELVPPRPLERSERGGVRVDDSSRRQTVFLEQELPEEMVRRLRGRSLVLDVRVRGLPEEQGATAGVFVEAGADPVVQGVPLFPGPVWVTLEIAVAEEAESVTVRLLPTDPTLGAEGQGSAIFERVVLRPPEWPRELTSGDLLLRGVLATRYRPVPGYVRAPVAVSRRPRRELERLWPRLAAIDATPERIRTLLAGELRAGMSREEVRWAWGDPDAVVEAPDVVGFDGRWEWADRSASFLDDRLVTWSVPGPEPPPQAPAPCVGGAGTPGTGRSAGEATGGARGGIVEGRGGARVARRSGAPR